MNFADFVHLAPPPPKPRPPRKKAYNNKNIVCVYKTCVKLNMTDFSHCFACRLCMCADIISEAAKPTDEFFLNSTQIVRFYTISIIGPYPISSNYIR